LKSLSDALNYRLPWRRKRLERDFSVMLAILLDAEVPEEQAVTLAAQSTDNGVFIRRGAVVAQRLCEGMRLTEAVQAFDDTGEFRWRLANAAHGRGGFMAALNGWHEALDAKAYQLEQTASQVITTSFVILNGCVVGLIAIGVFQMLTSVVWEATLW
jgi:type II secretory pathway component PulF